MSECLVENHTDFNESIELTYTDIDQISITRESFNKTLWENLRRIQELEDRIKAINVWEWNDWWENERVDTEKWLELTQLQSEIYTLTAENKHLKENLRRLLWEEQRLARTSPEQFNKYKDNVRLFLDGVIDVRLMLEGRKEIVFNPKNQLHLNFLQDIYSHISFFWFTWDDAIKAFQDTHSLDIIHAKITLMSFEDL